MPLLPARPGGALRRARPLLLSNAIDAGSLHAADLATDVIAVAALGATATQMGLLNALGTTAFLVLGIPIGVLVDRSPTVRTLMGSGLVRAVLLASLVLAWWLDGLTLVHLCVVALLAGVCSVVTETTQTALVPRLVGAGRVGTVVARMQSAETVVGLVAPAVAGGLAAVLGAGPLLAIAVAATALSAVVILPLRTESQAATPHDSTGGNEGPEEAADLARARGGLRRFLAEGRQGCTTMLEQPGLLRITLAAVVINLGLAIWSAIEVLVILRTLDLGTEVLGFILSAGALGGLIGSLVAVPLGSRIGPSVVMRGSMILLVPAATLVALAVHVPAHATALLMVHAALWGVLMVTYNVQLAGLVAEWIPTHLMGRVAATRRTLTGGVIPLGGILGGVIADRLGIAPTLLVWCLLNAVGAGLAVLAVSARDHASTAPAGPTT